MQNVFLIMNGCKLGSFFVHLNFKRSNFFFVFDREFMTKSFKCFFGIFRLSSFKSFSFFQTFVLIFFFSPIWSFFSQSWFDLILLLKSMKALKKTRKKKLKIKNVFVSLIFRRIILHYLLLSK